MSESSPKSFTEFLKGSIYYSGAQLFSSHNARATRSLTKFKNVISCHKDYILLDDISPSAS